ncbi:MAG: type II toxin-antitoxin system RelB/DinJ family antitoxin [Gammaproteobacteria bacterium]|nr:type II toxin-antitoxin system RelB/DinJ family antitoxin [Gammaproteobacteria bacterium]
MASTNFNIRLDQSLREQAFPVLERYGLTPAQAFKLFLNQVAKTQKVPLSFDWGEGDYHLSPKGEAMLRQSIQELENGEYTESTLDELLDWAKDNA